MTRITLSTGDKYTIEAPAAEIIKAMNRDRWISLEDDGRDIRVRSSHIVAIEEDTAAIIKEAEREQEQRGKLDGHIRCSICGIRKVSNHQNFVRFQGECYCNRCYGNLTELING